VTLAALTPAAMDIVCWLGELGPRWGLPADACRVHAMLYLVARPVPPQALAIQLSLDCVRIDAALAWLSQDGLATATAGGWTTGADPWALMMQALEARRAKELTPARDVLQNWRRDGKDEDPIVARQATRLLNLVENIAAMDATAHRLSPEAVHRLVVVGGRAARMFDRVFSRSSGRNE
jgi:hypothetical protein